MREIDVCYHHSDADGWASAAIVNAKKNYPMGYRAHYNSSEILGNIAGRHVAIVDFSFPESVMKMIAQAAKSLIWIDHHEDSKYLLEKDWWDSISTNTDMIKQGSKENGLTAIWDVSEAACVLCWNYLHTEVMPDSVKYIGDRDIWRFNHPETKDYNYGLDMLPGIADPRSTTWQELLYSNKLTENLIQAGQIISARVNSECIWHARLRSHIVQDGDRKFILTNCTSNMSEISAYLIETFDVPIVLMWDIAKDCLSLHGRGEGAREFFGGLLKGHPSACGAKLALPEGWGLIQELHKKARRVMP